MSFPVRRVGGNVSGTSLPGLATDKKFYRLCRLPGLKFGFWDLADACWFVEMGSVGSFGGGSVVHDPRNLLHVEMLCS